MNVQTVELQSHEVTRRTIVSELAILKMPGFEQQLEYRFRADLYGQKLSDFERRYPKDWLQAIKQRFAPAFILRRWPVQEEIIRIQTSVVFPEWVPTVNLGRPVILHIMNSKPGLFDYHEGS